MLCSLATSSFADNEKWIKITTWGSRQVFYDKNSVRTISQDEKEVVYCVVTHESSIVKQVRINKKTNKSAIGWNEGRKRNVKVSEFDFSKFGWVYSKIPPKSAESILVRKLWSNSR